MYSGSEFQIAEAAAGKARLPTVEILTDGTMRVDYAPGYVPNFCVTNADARSLLFSFKLEIRPISLTRPLIIVTKRTQSYDPTL